MSRVNYFSPENLSNSTKPSPRKTFSVIRVADGQEVRSIQADTVTLNSCSAVYEFYDDCKIVAIVPYHTVLVEENRG